MRIRKQMPPRKPVVLVIMDGFGDAPNSEYNAISSAKTPTFNSLKKDFPNGLINASETHVGLPKGQMGNSETGHMNIGGGRVMLTDYARIENSIADGSLEKKAELKNFIAKTKQEAGTVHLLGLISDGGVHSHQEHTTELAKIFAKNGLKVSLHLFTDGRDVPPQSALGFIDKLEKDIKDIPAISIATIGGRYFGMDRDKKWDRTQIAYNAMSSAKGDKESNAKNAVKKSYDAGKNDEFVVPTIIGDYKGMEDDDSLFISNFRKDRVKQISTAFLDPEFNDFKRDKKIEFSAKLSMTKYSDEISKLMPILFPPEQHKNVLAEIISEKGLKQLHIAESEKYSHVTEFFNGGRETPFKGEEHVKIPSPKVASYDLKPEMSAHEVTEKLISAINSDEYDFIVVNYANPDMVGHTGNIPATIKAIETIDQCLDKIKDAVLAKDGAMIVTADHGNADKMFDEITNQPHTAHTTNLVPVIMVSNNLRDKKSRHSRRQIE
jgi:2,3-bisphosphoglycerate-independent phosphoglycerate mutase